MKVAAVIPARLHSRRFARKVLARKTGKYLFQHVYERVVDCPCIDEVLVATDSEEVLEAGLSIGAQVVLTSAEHVSGTDRVAEVAQSLEHEIIINVQGDEPFISHDDLSTLVDLFKGGDREGGDREVVMTTLASRRDDLDGFQDPNIVKVVIGGDLDGRSGDAIYFSRSPVPYSSALSGSGGERVGGETRKGAALEWFQHIGIYAYRRDFLLKLATLTPTALEKRERLEQLRVLENGYTLRVGLTSNRHLGVDTAEEYEQFVQEYRAREEGGGRFGS